jgi:hypothetical protein
MYVCAQLFIIYVCMCSVIYKLCMYVLSYLFISYVCMCSVTYNLCMCVLSLLNWKVAILLFIEYDANKIKTIKCHLCHVCAQLFINYICMCSVIYKLCMYVIYWMWCKRNKDNYNVPVIFNSQA